MQVKASLKNYRRSARKVRELARVLRGMEIDKAVSQLLVWDKGSCKDLLNLLKSAVANAENNFKLKEDSLYISEIKVNEGPTLKRWRPRAHGRAAQILKRTCHMELTLDERQVERQKPVKSIKSEDKSISAKASVDKKAEKKEDSDKKKVEEKKLK
jgi:large subunit ribosomal protein L22